MKVSDRIVDIIEDHETMKQTLVAINYAMEKGLPMPVIPTLHDLMITDMICKVCERINKSLLP